MSRIMNYLNQVASACVLPHLAAIYSPCLQHGSSYVPVQTGSGFYLSWRGETVLLTAKHCLLGARGTEGLYEKCIFVGGGLQPLHSIQEVKFDICKKWDIAAIRSPVLPSVGLVGLISPNPYNDVPLTMIGYLAKKFRRNASASTTMPKPFLFTNSYVHQRSGEVGIKYERHKVVNAKTGKIVLSPVPVGVSGGVMLDSMSLLYRQQVVVRGLFTEYAGLNPLPGRNRGWELVRALLEFSVF